MITGKFKVSDHFWHWSEAFNPDPFQSTIPRIKAVILPVTELHGDVKGTQFRSTDLGGVEIEKFAGMLLVQAHRPFAPAVGFDARERAFVQGVNDNELFKAQGVVAAIG